MIYTDIFIFGFSISMSNKGMKSYLKSKPVPKSWQNAHALCLTATAFYRTPNLPDGLV